MESDDHLSLTSVSRTFRERAGLLSVLSKKRTGGTRAVDDVDLTIRRGETFALVAESGCGKSTLARLIAGLIRPDSGTIAFHEKRNDGLDAVAARPRLQVVFQDPFSSLNGRWTVGRSIAEPIRVHRLRHGRAVSQRVGELLTQVGLAATDAMKYPHEFSGGQRQRIAIARALAGDPDFRILDEPTSALDVSVQAQILNLLKDIQRELHLTYLFITHNLGVVRMVADRVCVMYLGQIVEIGPNPEIFLAPQHPYTKLLLEASLDLDTSDRSPHPIRGELPSPRNPPPGCRFHARCTWAFDRCIEEAPGLAVDGPTSVRCYTPLAGNDIGRA